MRLRLAGAAIAGLFGTRFFGNLVGRKTSHTATSDATPQPVWNSGTVAPAGSPTCDPNIDPYCTPGTTPPGTYVSSPFNTPGTYQYHCAFHGVQGPNFQGMTGTINVTTQ